MYTDFFNSRINSTRSIVPEISAEQVKVQQIHKKEKELIGATKPQGIGLEAREGVEGVDARGEVVDDSTDYSTASVEPSTFIKELEKPSSKEVKS